MLATCFTALSSKQQATLVDYVDQLIKWNTAYNLTAITEKKEIFIKHINDSLVINPFLQGEQILDVGTGAGLPGIPLAIANPNKNFTLLDSNGKKTRFIKQFVATFPLPNVEVVQSRVEKFQPIIAFDSIISRAFASIYDMLTLTQHLIKPNGIFLAMKGAVSNEELAHLPLGFALNSVERLTVPHLDAQRCVVIVRRKHD